jgi:hypothetical protein
MYPPIPVAARWAGGRSLVGIAGSNPAGSIDVCLLGVLSGVSLQDSAMGRSFVQRSPTECRVSK